MPAGDGGLGVGGTLVLPVQGKQGEEDQEEDGGWRVNGMSGELKMSAGLGGR